jgi:hypothetical protein
MDSKFRSKVRIAGRAEMQEAAIEWEGLARQERGSNDLKEVLARERNRSGSGRQGGKSRRMTLSLVEGD